ncbi:MAG: hypothetical protein L0Y72_27605 [Gemmataceae bacterium]|nr:hypothetical protein [Gemmataceae bacterium]MCI0742813.1 hypothetical protein [Gemmataceae bacterium]
MISGDVSNELEPVIQLELEVGSGVKQAIRAVVDTGFNGYLTLPEKTAAALGLVWIGAEEGILADGSTKIFQVFEANVNWEGTLRKLAIQASDSSPLVGMAMLEHYELRIQVTVGGKVVVTKMQEQ